MAKRKRKRQTMADKQAMFAAFGNKLGYKLEFRKVSNRIKRSRQQWFSLTARKIWRHAKKNLRKGNPNHYQRLKKSKSKPLSNPFTYSEKIDKALIYGFDFANDVMLIGPMRNPEAQRNIITGIPSSDRGGRPETTPLSVLIFGGKSKMADRDVEPDDDVNKAFGRGTRDFISIAEWRDEGRPIKTRDITPRPFMQYALWRVMNQKETIKNFKIRN